MTLLEHIAKLTALAAAGDLLGFEEHRHEMRGLLITDHEHEQVQKIADDLEQLIEETIL